MTSVRRQLLLCLRAYRGGEGRAEQIESLSPEQWRELYVLSAAHKLIPVVYDTLYDLPGFCAGAEELAQLWKKDAILQTMGQTTRSQRLLEVTGALEEAGICCPVVKGIHCRRLYAKGDLRPSGDEDLFLSRAELSRCEGVLTRLGFEKRSSGEEAVEHWRDPGTGLHLEVHTALFSTGWAAEEILNPYFEQALNRTVMAAGEGGSVRALNPTDHLVFLVAHALKHFITGGFGVRTLSDILSFCERYGEEICRDTLWNMLEQIRGAVFFRALLGVGQHYLNFDAAPWGCFTSEPSDVNGLLLDMLDAGIYGQTSMERRHSAAMVLQAARGKGKRSLLSTLFPPADQLVGRYPILRRAPVLLPVAWMCRICGYGAELIRDRGTGNSPGAALALGNQRMELMIRYEVFPQGKTENR